VVTEKRRRVKAYVFFLKVETKGETGPYLGRIERAATFEKKRAGLMLRPK
jgi:hypothetical protein